MKWRQYTKKANHNKKTKGVCAKATPLHKKLFPLFPHYRRYIGNHPCCPMRFKKTSSDTSTLAMVYVDGNASKISFNDCKAQISGATTSTFVDADAAENVYFMNARSSNANGVNITDSASPSGYNGSDTNLNIL